MIFVVLLDILLKFITVASVKFDGHKTPWRTLFLPNICLNYVFYHDLKLASKNKGTCGLILLLTSHELEKTYDRPIWFFVTIYTYVDLNRS